jgi:hypothetical protein
VFNKSKAQISSRFHFLNSWQISVIDGSSRLGYALIVVQNKLSASLLCRCFNIYAKWHFWWSELRTSDHASASVSSQCVESPYGVWSEIHTVVDVVRWYQLVYLSGSVPNWFLCQIQWIPSKFLTIASLLSIVLIYWYDLRWVRRSLLALSHVKVQHCLILYSTDRYQSNHSQFFDA